jgi:hypothetical protein
MSERRDSRAVAESPIERKGIVEVGRRAALGALGEMPLTGPTASIQDFYKFGEHKNYRRRLCGQAWWMLAHHYTANRLWQNPLLEDASGAQPHFPLQFINEPNFIPDLSDKPYSAFAHNQESKSFENKLSGVVVPTIAEYLDVRAALMQDNGGQWLKEAALAREKEIEIALFLRELVEHKT